MKTKNIILIALVLVVALASGYWLIFMRDNSSTDTQTDETSSDNGFMPINRVVNNRSDETNGVSTNNNNTSTTTNTTTKKMPVLRLLSDTPVGGYGASTTVIIVEVPTSTLALGTTSTSTQKITKPKTTTKETTVVRWIDRGRGNTYEANSESLDIKTLSNTIVPRVFDSVWNTNLTALVGSMFNEDSVSISTIYGYLKPQTASSSSKTSATRSTGTTTSTSTSLVNKNVAPYELKGGNMPKNVVAYAASPKKDKLFMFIDESGAGVGYVSSFDGKSVTKIFNTPITQVTADWPEDNTIIITTKGSYSLNGFAYAVNPKTGTWKKVAGPLPGLGAKVSHDAKYAIISASGKDNNILTSIYSIKDSKATNAVIKTLADKCAWGNFYKEMLYCAVPAQPKSARYPDDWYRGAVSLSDKIWQINAETGEIHLVSSVSYEGGRDIDAFNLSLDKKDAYLFFMNKNDLSLWSLDLVSSK